MRPILHQIATLGPIGRHVSAPGTAGSLAALPLGYLLLQISWLTLLVASVLSVALGIWAANSYERGTGKKDASEVVIDEVSGMWITLLFVPNTILWILAAFILFRLFDIVKPGPVKLLEQLPEGYGVMADDIAAALLAGMVLLVLQVMVAVSAGNL